jgi:hypothetical protein
MIELLQPKSGSISVLIVDADRTSANLIADGLTRGRHDSSIVAVSNTSAETIRELERSQPNVGLINATPKTARCGNTTSRNACDRSVTRQWQLY